MINSLLKSYQIMFTQKVNMWIYYFKKVPIIGKQISDDAYSDSEFKIVAPTIVAILSLILGFITKFIYIFVFIILPALLMSKFNFAGDTASLNEDSIKYHLLFFLNFIAGPLSQNKFTDEVQKDFIMVKLMRFEAKTYYLSKILLLGIKSFIYFLFPLMLLKFSFLESLIISLELSFLRSIIQSMHILTGKPNRVQHSTRWYYVLPFIIIPFLSAFALPFFGIIFNAKSLILSIPFILITYTLGIVSLIYLFKNNKYRLLSKSMYTQSNINPLSSVQVSSADINFANVQFKEKDVMNGNLKEDKYKDKHGIEYLNLKFIQRHKRIVIFPIVRVTALILILFCISIGIVLAAPELHADVSEYILSINGLLVFIFYTISNGEKLTRAFFFNCDNSLLRHNFYREPKTILTNFRYRLKVAVFLNLIPALTLGISLCIIYILCGGTISRFVPLFISILTLPVFFAVHYLFLYYIVQPYTMQLTVKSPIYKFAGFIIYIVSYTCMFIETSSIIFTLAIILITLIYTIAALILVYKFAPKNFKLK